MKSTENGSYDPAQPPLIHPVIELINRRFNGQTDDQNKLALVIEGGGMRGVFTASMGASLESAGISPDIFDMIVGTSSGALNGSFYAGRNLTSGISFYTNQNLARRYLNKTRVFTGSPAMKTGILLRDLMEQIIPLDWDKVIEDKKLYVTAFDLKEHVTKVFTPAKNKAELKDRLQASSHIPIISGIHPFLVDEVEYCDGSMAAPLPWQQAVDLGATHVLALSSRNLGEWRDKQSLVELMVARYYDKRWPGLFEAIFSAVSDNKSESSLLRKKLYRPAEAPHILTVDSPPGFRLGPLEQDPSKLLAAKAAGARAVAGYIQQMITPRKTWPAKHV